MMKTFQRIVALTFILMLMIGLTFSNITLVHAAPNNGNAAEGVTEQNVNETSLYETDEATDITKKGDIESTEIYNIYAQIIMNQKQKDEKTQEKEAKEAKKKKSEGLGEKALDKAKDFGKKVYDPSKVKKDVRNIIGDGGTLIDVGYTEMYSLANALRGYKTKDEKDNIGTQMAAFLATYNHYGYISSVSGQKALVGTQGAMDKLGRTLFGGVVALALALYTGVNTLLDWVLDALIGLNPLSLLGFSEGGKAMTDNPVSNFIHDVFQKAGINNTFLDKIADLGLVFVIFFICIGSIIFMTIGAKRRWLQLAKKGALLLFAYTAFLPILGFVVSGIAEQVQDLRANSIIHENPANQYLLNARGWAASSNLSPTGLDGAAFPMAKADDGYIDKDFDPIRSRDMIAGINERTYSTLYGMGKEASGFDLLDKWMKNENFNVNDYMSDIRRGSLPNGEEQLPAYDNLSEAYNGYDIEKKDIANVLWSGNQMYDEKTAKVTHKNYKPDSNLGVRETNSFSTQSVVLLLQSSFSNGSAHFYAYNLPPKGIQGELKNLTTAKTEWKEVTLPGDGPLGVVGSWFGLAGASIVYTMVTISVVIALLSFTLLENLIRIFKNIFKLYVLLNVYAMYAITFLVIASVLTFILALSAGDIAMIIINGVSSTIDKAFNGAIPSGIISIIISLVSIFVAYYIGFKKPRYNSEPLIRTYVNLFMNMAFAYDDKVTRMTSNFDSSRKVDEAKRKLFNKESKQSENYNSERRTGYASDGEGTTTDDRYPATYNSEANSSGYVNRFARRRRHNQDIVDTRNYGKKGIKDQENEQAEPNEDGQRSNGPTEEQQGEEQYTKQQNQSSYRFNRTSSQELTDKDVKNMTEEEKEELRQRGLLKSDTTTEQTNQNTESQDSEFKKFYKEEAKSAAEDGVVAGTEALTGVDLSGAKTAKDSVDTAKDVKEGFKQPNGKSDGLDELDGYSHVTKQSKGRAGKNNSDSSNGNTNGAQATNEQTNDQQSSDSNITNHSGVYGQTRSRRTGNKPTTSNSSATSKTPNTTKTSNASTTSNKTSKPQTQNAKQPENKRKQDVKKPKGYARHKGKPTRSEERARRRFERQKHTHKTKTTTQSVDTTTENQTQSTTDYEYTRAAKKRPKK